MKMQGGSSEILVSPCSVSMFKGNCHVHNQDIDFQIMDSMKDTSFALRNTCVVFMLLGVFGDPLYWTSMEFNLSQSLFMFSVSIFAGFRSLIFQMFGKSDADLIETSRSW